MGSSKANIKQKITATDPFFPISLDAKTLDLSLISPIRYSLIEVRSEKTGAAVASSKYECVVYNITDTNGWVPVSLNSLLLHVVALLIRTYSRQQNSVLILHAPTFSWHSFLLMHHSYTKTSFLHQVWSERYFPSPCAVTQSDRSIKSHRSPPIPQSHPTMTNMKTDDNFTLSSPPPLSLLQCLRHDYERRRLLPGPPMTQGTTTTPTSPTPSSRRLDSTRRAALLAILDEALAEIDDDLLEGPTHNNVDEHDESQ